MDHASIGILPAKTDDSALYLRMCAFPMSPCQSRVPPLSRMIHGRRRKKGMIMRHVRWEPTPQGERSIVVDAKPKIQETIAGNIILLSTIIVWCLGVL